MLSGVNQGRVGFYSTKSGSCPQLKVYSWGDNHFAFSYHRIVELHSSRNVCSGSGQATKISTALVVYVSTSGAPASTQSQLLGLLKFLETAIQSCDWGLALFYTHQIMRVLTRLDVDPVAVSSVGGLLGN